MGKRVFRRRTVRRRTGRKLNARQRTQVKRIIGKQEEDKFLDVYTGATSIPSGTGALIGPFTNVPQGDTVNGRTGDVIQHRKLECRFQVQSADVVNAIRIILFKWNYNDSFDTPTAIKIIQDTVTQPWLSPLTDLSVESNRYTVLMDRLFTNFNAGDTNMRVWKSTFFGKRLGKKKAVFNPAAGTGVGNIYMLAVSDSIAASHPAVALSTRLHFTDS